MEPLNKEPAIDFLTKERKPKPAYTHRNGNTILRIEFDSRTRVLIPRVVKTLIQICGEQGQLKGPLPNPVKYVDQSYLKDALRELGNDELRFQEI